MSNDRLLSFLGLCRRAGCLIYGAETVQKSLREGKTLLALAAGDVSRHSLSDTEFTAHRCGAPFRTLPCRADELSAAIGKTCGIVGVTDRGFADKILTMTAEGAGLPPAGTNTPQRTEPNKEE